MASGKGSHSVALAMTLDGHEVVGSDWNIWNF